ncbi:MAG: hypothetical protein AAGI51_15930, partial [Pseudomonadota bacterium]
LGAAAPAQAQNEDRPLIERADDGAFLARFAGGCRVSYDASGNRTGAESCREIEIGNADAMVINQVRLEGGALTFERTSRGAGRIAYEDGCIVTYKHTGRRSGSQNCTPERVQRADRYVQRHWND